MKVLYVYYGTLGLAGSYLDGINRAAAAIDGLEVHCAVSRYYRFPAHRSRLLKVFYPFTESTPENPFPHRWLPRALRLPLRYLELCLGYLLVLIYVRRHRIGIVNVAMIDDYVLTLRFLDALHAMGVRIHLTAHDSTPHGKVVDGRRKYAYSLAERIVVHYPHVGRDVVAGFDVPPAKIASTSYPSADATAVLEPAAFAAALDDARRIRGAARRVFLFIGILRTEKGLGDMMAAWARRDGGHEDLLVVAGRPVSSAPLPGADRPDVRYVPRYLTSEEFQAWLEVADVVVLPYAIRNYAHSAVLLMAWLARRTVIASDIPLFSGLVDDRTGYVVEAGNVDALARALDAVGAAPAQELAARGAAGREAVLRDWQQLPAELARLYGLPWASMAAVEPATSAPLA